MLFSTSAFARFYGIDPVGVDPTNPHSFNRYGYANNNPYKFVDPDGRDAIITHRKDGSIGIQIPINFSGPGATPQNISRISSDIKSKWSGTHNIGGTSTKVDVTVTTPVAGGIKNDIILTNGPTSLKKCNGCSFVQGGNSGEWNTKSRGMTLGMPAHEGGHLMGGDDHYKSKIGANGRRTTAPEPKWKGNLMGQLPGKTSGKNFDEILKSKSNVTKRQK